MQQNVQMKPSGVQKQTEEEVTALMNQFPRQYQ